MWIDHRHPAIQLCGTEVPEKSLWRVPDEVAREVSEGVHYLSKQNSGVRLLFQSDSRRIGLRLRYAQISNFYHMPVSGVCGIDLFEHLRVGEDGRPETGAEWKRGYVSPGGVMSVWLHHFPIPWNIHETMTCEAAWEQPEAGMHHYCLYLPLYANLESIEIELDDGSRLEPHGIPYVNDEPYVFYGSSITQGGCANKPSNSYPAILGRRRHLDFINLGFSGNAKGEHVMADYIASLHMKALVCDYDYNAPDARWLEETHRPFYERIRAQRPDLPIYILSSAAWPRSEAELREKNERRAIIERTYQRGLEAGDQNLLYIDMRPCFDGPLAQDYTVDGVHPTGAGFMRMADYLEPRIFGAES